MLRVALGAPEAARVTRALAERGLYLTELRPEEVSLERVFLELTGEAEHPGVAPAGTAPLSHHTSLRRHRGGDADISRPCPGGGLRWGASWSSRHDGSWPVDWCGSPAA